MVNNPYKVLTEDVVIKAQALVKENRVMGQVFRELARREKAKSVTRLYRLRLKLNHGGINISDVEMLRLFTQLEKERFGKVRYTKSVIDMGFIWDYDGTKLAKAALGIGTVSFTKPAADVLERLEGPKEAVPAPRVADPTGIEVYCAYKPGRALKLTLPRDFTTGDAEVLSQFLRSMAIELGNR